MTIKNKDIPEFLERGERARLIPVVSDGSREGRATSILLSTLSAVNEFSQNIFGDIGVRIGNRARVDVFTEIVFADKENNSKIRPDGLIVIDTGRTQWKAIVESKIGNAELSPDQVKDYISLAKKFNIDAVITISNQYSASPSHHPLQLKRTDMKGIELFHWSWMYLLTEAVLLLKSLGVDDGDQRFILSEMVRYYDHDKVGVSSFDQMNAEWKDVTLQVRNGSSLSKTATEVESTIVAWHQEARDLCLTMSRQIAVPVSLRLSRAHKKNPLERVRDDCEQLVNNKTLTCELEIPDAASPLVVTADLARRTIGCLMNMSAPKDKQRATAKLNWLLRQLKDVSNTSDLYIRLITSGRTSNPQISLQVARDNPGSALMNEGVEVQPVSFDVIMIKDVAGKFSGRTTFIDVLEETVQSFYEIVGQNLKAWVPDAPKVKKDELKSASVTDENHVVALVPVDPRIDVNTEEEQSMAKAVELLDIDKSIANE